MPSVLEVMEQCQRTHSPSSQRGCDKFLYGFKGARLRLPPGAGRARAATVS